MIRGRRIWFSLPLLVLLFHTVFLFVEEFERAHASGVVQYALPVIDPMAVIILIARDSASQGLLWLIGTIQWLVISLVICSFIEYRRYKFRPHYRRKRGLCPACAYPIGTSPVCTECGAAIQPQRGAGM